MKFLHNRTKIAFDANMLLAIQQFKVDVFLEVEKMFGKGALLAVPAQVFQEVLALSKGSMATKKAAGIALQEMQNHKVKVMGVDAGSADDALVQMAKGSYMVASNDAVLRKRIKGFAGKVIYLRQKRFLKLG